MTATPLSLTLLPEMFAICRLSPDAPLPAWADAGPFVSITRTRDELSIVCAQWTVPAGVSRDVDWRCLKVEGPFDLATTTGVLASLAMPLARAGISLFVVATFDTDYLLVKDQALPRAVPALSGEGYRVQ